MAFTISIVLSVLLVSSVCAEVSLPTELAEQLAAQQLQMERQQNRLIQLNTEFDQLVDDISAHAVGVQFRVERRVQQAAATGDERVNYELIHENHGDRFQNGDFVAPYAGYYYFSHSHWATTSTYIYTTVNGAKVAEAGVNSNIEFEYITTGVVLHLQVGDVVSNHLKDMQGVNRGKIECRAGQQGRCVFEGVMLSAI